MDLQETDKIIISHIIERKKEEYKSNDKELINLLELFKKIIKK